MSEPPTGAWRRVRAWHRFSAARHGDSGASSQGVEASTPTGLACVPVPLLPRGHLVHPGSAVAVFGPAGQDAESAGSRRPTIRGRLLAAPDTDPSTGPATPAAASATTPPSSISSSQTSPTPPSRSTLDPARRRSTAPRLCGLPGRLSCSLPGAWLAARAPRAAGPAAATTGRRSPPASSNAYSASCRSTSRRRERLRSAHAPPESPTAAPPTEGPARIGPTPAGPRCSRLLPDATMQSCKYGHHEATRTRGAMCAASEADDLRARTAQIGVQPGPTTVIGLDSVLEGTRRRGRPAERATSSSAALASTRSARPATTRRAASTSQSSGTGSTGAPPSSSARATTPRSAPTRRRHATSR